MQKLLNTILFFLIAIASATSFADIGTTNLPWHLENNVIEECWWGKDVRGQNVVVEVWDSKVKFISLLKDKEYKKGHKSYVTNCTKDNYDRKAAFHGTGIASLIAADRGELNCSISSQHPCKQTVIAGIAPDARIFNRELVNQCGEFSTKDRFEILMDSLKLRKKTDLETVVNYAGKNVIISEPDVKEAKIILVNASIVEGMRDYIDMGQLKKQDNFKHLLIVAAVGNLVKEIKNDIIPYPAKLKLRKGFNVLAVGATRQYKNNQRIELLDFTETGSQAGSSYGEIVDILAPGEKIPILTHREEAYVGDGTSESTAVVTGALTLLASCNPYATASELKDALLTNTDEFKHLETKVNQGRVLNIRKAVNNYCHPHVAETNDNNICDEKGVCTKTELY